MLVKKKCTNLDCKDYDVIHTVPTAEGFVSVYCPTCCLGKLDILMDQDAWPQSNEEELIAADFDISKILQR